MDIRNRHRAYSCPLIDDIRLGGSYKVNLILGPGAARGFMHLGAIRALLEEGYEIRSLIGSSSGAFIALLYAKTRNIDEVEQLINGIGFRELFHRPDGHVTVASL